MRLLAVIPARAGSKRLPGKNVRLLGGKPLIVWSIEAAQGIEAICDILVSTDDATTATIARNSGAMAPWLRPADLSTDTATSVDVCLHALEWYEGASGVVDGLLLLQPTSPFRSRASMIRGIELFRANPLRPVVGLSAAKSHPMWCYRVEEGVMRPFIAGVSGNLRSQDLPPAFVVNGAIYLVTPEHLRLRRSFEDDESAPLLLTETDEDVDIDTEHDWALADAIVRARR